MIPLKRDHREIAMPGINGVEYWNVGSGEMGARFDGSKIMVQKGGTIFINTASNKEINLPVADRLREPMFHHTIHISLPYQGEN